MCVLIRFESWGFCDSGGVLRLMHSDWFLELLELREIFKILELLAAMNSLVWRRCTNIPNLLAYSATIRRWLVVLAVLCSSSRGSSRCASIFRCGNLRLEE